MGYRGRPKKDEGETKSEEFRIRLSKDEKERLNRVSKAMKISKSETIRVLILEAENILKNKDEK